MIQLCVGYALGDGSKTSTSGSIYKPTSSLMQKIEENKNKEEEKSLLSIASSTKGKPQVHMSVHVFIDELTAFKSCFVT